VTRAEHYHVSIHRPHCIGYTRIILAGSEPVDVIVAAIVAIAALRGLMLGLVREAFSLGAIAAAYLAVRTFVDPIADWLFDVSDGQITQGLAPWVGGALLVVFTVGMSTGLGRILRRGVRSVGLGLADRLGGALLGTGEGVVVVALLLMLAGDHLGWDHPALADTRTLATLEELELLAREAPSGGLDVASPPPSSL
jgi:membrane protein required for colicin V production